MKKIPYGHLRTAVLAFLAATLLGPLPRMTSVVSTLPEYRVTVWYLDLFILAGLVLTVVMSIAAIVFNAKLEMRAKK